MADPTCPMFDVQARIRDYIARNMLFSEHYPYDDDQQFFTVGVLDSLGVAELASFVEREFGVPVLMSEVLPENFGSISALAAYVHSKLGGSKVPAAIVAA